MEPVRGEEINRTDTADPPVECRGCRAGLDRAVQAVPGWAQVWDIPPIAMAKVEVLPRLRCGYCGTTTTATVPFGRSGDLGATELTLHRVRPVGHAADGAVTEVTWEQTALLHTQLTGIELGGMRINTEILLPERCAPPADVIEKLEIAPDGRVYLSCAEVAGPGRTVKYDFAQAALVPAGTA